MCISCFLDWLMADNIVPIIRLKMFGEEWDETNFTKSIVANELNPIVVSIPNWGWWNCIYHYISTHQTSAPRHINNAPKIAPNLTFKHLCIHQHIPQKTSTTRRCAWPNGHVGHLYQWSRGSALGVSAAWHPDRLNLMYSSKQKKMPVGPKKTSISIWVNYNDLTATSLGIMVNKGNHPQMALIQVSEIL